MAQFCTKCGTPLAEGMSFCTGCGATIGAPAAPAPLAPAPVAPMPPAPVAAAPMAAAPAAKKGSPVLKIVLIVLAVLFFLGLVSLGSCVYFVYRVKQKANQIEKQARATFPMQMGTREVHTQPGMSGTTPSQPTGPVVDTGVAVYPGATATGAGGQMSMGAGSVKTQAYLTDDSVDKVVAFYKDKLGPTAMTSQNGQQALVQVVGESGVISVVIAPDPSSGKTKISISNMGK